MTKHDIGAGFTAEFHGVGLTIRGPLADQVIDLDREQLDKLREILGRVFNR
jgi:hypothetical protein